MIILKDLDFEMEQVKKTPFFDLKMQTVINAGKANERTEMKLVGYGMPFETCIEHVVSYKLNSLDKTFSIVEYIIEYEKIVKSLLELAEFHIDEKHETDTVKDDESQEDFSENLDNLTDEI